MISNEMFGSDIIRIKINGYLKNNTDNKIFKFNEKGIINKNKVSYYYDNVKYNVMFNKDEVILRRESDEFINTFYFNGGNSRSNYLLKDNNYEVDIDVTLKELIVRDNSIYIKYVIVDSGCEYEFKMKMRDV